VRSLFLRIERATTALATAMACAMLVAAARLASGSRATSAEVDVFESPKTVSSRGVVSITWKITTRAFTIDAATSAWDWWVVSSGWSPAATVSASSASWLSLASTSRSSSDGTTIR